MRGRDSSSWRCPIVPAQVAPARTGKQYQARLSALRFYQIRSVRSTFAEARDLVPTARLWCCPPAIAPPMHACFGGPSLKPLLTPRGLRRFSENCQACSWQATLRFLCPRTSFLVSSHCFRPSSKKLDEAVGGS
jgi:hypothetical protein